MTDPQQTTTARGFENVAFLDANNVSCSVQISSAWQDEKLIWIGTNIKHVQVGFPWKDVPFAEVKEALGGHKHIQVATRMHLTQSQVRNLLPILQQFVDTGSLDEEE